MIVPDANLLLYTVDSTSPFHDVAREWWTSCLNGAVPVGLCHPVMFRIRSNQHQSPRLRASAVSGSSHRNHPVLE